MTTITRGTDEQRCFGAVLHLATAGARDFSSVQILDSVPPAAPAHG